MTDQQDITQLVITDPALRDYLTRLNEQNKRLRAQVEELSKYPEEAVRAVWLVSRAYRKSAVTYLDVKDRLAAIFNEKQGVGKWL